MIAFFLSPIGKIVGAIGIIAAAFLGFRLWLASHDSALLAGYVSRVEAAAAMAQVEEMQRQLHAGQIVIDSYQVQLKNLRAAQELEDIEDAIRDTSYVEKLKAAGSNRGLTADDIDYLLRKQP